MEDFGAVSAETRWPWQIFSNGAPLLVTAFPLAQGAQARSSSSTTFCMSKVLT